MRRPQVWLAFAVFLFALLLIAPRVHPSGMLVALAANLLGALAILVWWLFFSRLPHLDRWLTLAFTVGTVLALKPLMHVSVAGLGQRIFYFFFAVPLACLGLTLGATLGRNLAPNARRAVLAACILLVSSSLALVRSEGVRGEGGSQFAWRWTPTPEERLVAAEPLPGPEPAPEPPKPAEPVPAPAPASEPPPEAAPAKPAAAPPEWPGFRGPDRDSRAAGIRIETDWAATPPKELWRRDVGPGWSSFAVGYGLAYTQEQRGENEVIAAYQLETGKPAWAHRDAARFYEANAGPGPRGTPTLHNGRLYAIGATGIVSALDAKTGAVLWSRNAATDTGAPIPTWGISSSPLVINGLVVVAASGRLAAYDPASGKKIWNGPTIGGSYSSPHHVTFGKSDQIVFLAGQAIVGLSPGDGKLLWKHPWEGGKILQPAVAPDGALLVTNGGMAGGEATRRLTIAPAATGEWTATESWTSRGLKPYYNDLVVHKGHAYGFDGSILSCIDLNDGQRKWKGGRYGHGQMLLLPDQDLLLVLSEDGELALVSATPDQHKELARFKAIEGKTWNHPAIAGDIVLVRNDREMAAFRLARKSD
ncbi:MAG: PQQ-binding-like beta-propeller repeat protein [Bryobacteraceae bacterium]|nr:PQQ-binding-like beta-propeller repeat protein [Bryobacteraceae bacterium]